AAYAGERVSSGIRVLTEAAGRIRQGNYSEPAGIHSEDEVGVLGTAFDSMAQSISDQTTALQQAAEEETALRNQLEAVVAGMGEALLAVDAIGRVTLFNRAAEELLGVDHDEVLGELVGDVLVAVGEDGAILGPRLQRPSPTRWSVTATVATELGPRIPVAITSGALRGLDGSVVGAVLVLRDLRPERAVERMKSEFLSRIGHELRTPLTGILGYAEILLRRPVPEARARDMHQQIVDAGRRLYRVVQMLEFSAAAEAGRTLLRSEPTDVRGVVNEVVGGWSERLNGNHALARRVARRLPDIRGDRRWLAMAIDELIDNAVKFSPDGGKVAVTAKVVPWDHDADGRPAVEITVSDEGVGMNESQQRDAFSDFVQVDGSDTRRFGGLGLGLSLVKRVAEAHGGGVEVHSTAHKGSKFSIIIPALSMEKGK
ncbi:MAG TPA: ATP-binding protein, partial [Acidimicrobiales bacterium]